MTKNPRGRSKKIEKLLDNTGTHVLMTFQVEESLRTAANNKAKETSINLSQFLRQCVHEFTTSNEVGRATKQLQKDITRKALN